VQRLGLSDKRNSVWVKAHGLWVTGYGMLVQVAGERLQVMGCWSKLRVKGYRLWDVGPSCG
jgi:hypothetical protein